MRNWIDLFEARIPHVVYVGTVDADRRSVEPLTQVMPSREAAERVFSNTWGTPHGAMLAFSFHPRLLVHVEYDGSGLTSDGIAELLQDRYPAVTGRNLLPFLERKGIDALRFDTPNGEDFIIINPAILSYEKTLPLEHHEMALSETAEFQEKSGGWLLPSGEILPCSRFENRHHVNVAAEHFNYERDIDPSDPYAELFDEREIEEVFDLAFNAGWVRFGQIAGTVVVELPRTLAAKSVRALARIARTYDGWPEYMIEVRHGQAREFPDHRSFMMAIARLGETMVTEAPIADISFIGDHKPASLRADDIGIVTSPKAQMKMRRVLDNAPLPINLVFLNHSIGYEDEENIGNPMRKLKSGEHASGAMSAERFKKVYGYDLPADATAVTAVFAFNEGTERRPMTPWLVAHRLAHLVEEADYSSGRGPIARVMVDLQERWRDLGYDVVGLADIQNLCQEIGTTKASREGHVVNFGEFIAECFAQFIVTGRIRLNPVTKTMNMRVMHDVDRRYPKLADMMRNSPEQDVPNPDAANAMLEQWTKDAAEAFGNALEALKGQIVVM